jgi:hypothetical protein
MVIWLYHFHAELAVGALDSGYDRDFDLQCVYGSEDTSGNHVALSYAYISSVQGSASKDVDENHIYLYKKGSGYTTCGFFSTRRNASLIVSGVAFPPASRKLALFPRKSLIVSFVAIASPAPLTTLDG